MSISCPDCFASMPDTAAFCPGCGRAMRAAERARGMVGVLPEAVAGALAYFLLPAIFFILVKPYAGNRFVRFHSFQCIGLCLAGVIIAATLRVGGVVLYLIPVLGHLLIWLLAMVVSLAFFLIWIVLLVKALQGEMFELLWIGSVATRLASQR